MKKLEWTATALGIMTVLACSDDGGGGAARLDDQGAGGASAGADPTWSGAGDLVASTGGAAYGSGGSGGSYLASGREFAAAGGSGSAVGAAGGSAGAAADDTATYEAVGTNPFTMTAHDPLSTFAADVDTASYDIFTQYLSNGTLPPPESVRLEEFVNYFHYDYAPPAADAEHPFAIDLEAAPSVFEAGTATLRVGIQTKLPTPFEKRPANLVFLVDTSGSMAQELPLVKLVLLETLDILEPTDTLAIVTYAGGTRLALPPTPVSDRVAIEATIQSFESGGSTNGSGGIQLAYDQAASSFLEGGINHVLLCTDGDFNVGVTGTDALVALIEEKRKTGITFTALGFGTSGVNDAMMELVSNKGNGIYGVISSDAQARAYVEDRMLSNLQLVAKDMKIQVEFNPDHVLAYRLLGYENRAIADQLFRDDTVDAGEVGAGHQVTALYEVVPVGGAVPGADAGALVDDGAPYDGLVEVAPEDMVFVKVRYKDVDATETDPAYEVGASLNAAQMSASIEAAGTDTRWAFGVAAFAEILKESPFARTDQISKVRAILETSNGTQGDRLSFVDHLKTVTGLLGL